jgi:hypothetical protein
MVSQEAPALVRDAARRVAERAGYGHKWKQRKLILRTGTDQLPPLPGAATFFRRSDDYGSGIGRRAGSLLLERERWDGCVW